MSPTCVIIHYGGIWSNDIYDGGEKRLLPVRADDFSYTRLLSQIEVMIDLDKNQFTYSVSSIVQSPEGDLVRVNVMNDFDLQFVMDSCVVPKLFITLSPLLNHSSSHVFKQPGVVDKGFVDLLIAQNSFPRTSNKGNDIVSSHMVHSASFDASSDGGRSQGSNAVSYDLDVDDVMYRQIYDHIENLFSDSHSSDGGDVHVDQTVIGNLAIRNKHTLHSLGSSSLNDVVDDDILQGDSSKSSSRQWVVPGALYQASIPEVSSKQCVQYKRDSFSLGAIYRSKESLQDAVGSYHLLNRVEFVVDRSSGTRYSVTCKHNCQFILNASVCGEEWRVTRFDEPHTCVLDLRRHSDRTLSAKVIGSFFAPTLLDERAVLKPKEMCSKLEREYGFHVDYNVALAGRDHAIRLIHGDADKSFQLLPSFLYMVQQCNPGSIVSLKTDSEERFQYVFMALSTSVSGFLSSCRPVIIVDGTHLKGRYKGIMFVASTQDGNEQILPLAVGIGDKESDSSWTWFFEQLKKTFGCPQNLVFISDQHRSIHNAIEMVYPGVPHCLCTYHLQKNLATYGKNVIALFQQAAYCYSTRDFDDHMNSLAIVSDSAHRKLMGLDPCRWARSKCAVRRYDFLTSNCAEALNSRYRWARKLPICSMLECVRTILGQWFVERRTEALARTHELTPFAATKLEKSIKEGQTMGVEAINISKFKVSFLGKHHVVDLDSKSCSCREFDLDLIPCPHAAAAICKKNLSLISFVSSYYTMETLRDTYAGDVNPIPHPDEWSVPIEVGSKIVGVPSNPKQAERPRTSRIRSRGESFSRTRGRLCSRCKHPGHYRSTCTEHIPNPHVQSAGNCKARHRNISDIYSESSQPKTKKVHLV